MSVQILIGDCQEKLATLPDGSVHCCVTSPPYWGLRDYGVEGMIGLEASFDEWLAVMVEVFREVRRVLRKDGTLWLNIGDAYAGSPNGRSAADTKALGKDDRTFRDRPINTATGDFKSKDLMMMPARLALALQADGWWLRSEIVWSKPNPMPESVNDRPTSAHEKVYLLTKSARYFFDAEAVREDGPTYTRKAGGYSNHHEQGASRFGGKGGFSDSDVTTVGRNLRNVWTIATAPFPEAHFATFPPALVEPCIKAGTSERGVCGECGAPWVRQTTVVQVPTQDTNGPEKQEAVTGWDRSKWPCTRKASETTGWQPSCDCHVMRGPISEMIGEPKQPVQAAVLDPFAGAGTTGLVADRLGRDAILIELNPDYAEMARSRIERDAGMFSEVTNERGAVSGASPAPATLHIEDV